MKKSDLKTGMIIRIRKGESYFVFTNALTDYTNDHSFAVRTDGDDWIDIHEYHEDLTHSYGGSSWDIVEVITIGHPRDIYQSFSSRTTVWIREEKTESQVQLEAVMSKVSELQKEAQRLQEIVAKESK